MKMTLGTILIVASYMLHQDPWFWTRAHPIVFGILPIGLFYHAAYTAALPLALLVIVRLLWPTALENASPLDPDA